MGEVSRQQQYVYDRNVCPTQFIPDSPPITHREEKQGHTENKVVESHVKQVVVGIDKPNQPENYVFLLYTVQEIEERQR